MNIPRIARPVFTAIVILFAGMMLAGIGATPTVSAERPAEEGCPAGGCPPPGSSSATELEVCEAGDACNTFLDKYVEPFVTLLTISVGIIAAISVVVAGIQYASAGDDPGKVSKAKDRVWQTVIGLLAYIFLFAFLNYLVPGGII